MFFLSAKTNYIQVAASECDFELFNKVNLTYKKAIKPVAKIVSQNILLLNNEHTVRSQIA